MTRAMSLLIVTACLCCCGSPENAGEASRAQSNLRELKADLLSGQIEHVEILHVPYELSPSVGISPKFMDAYSSDSDRRVVGLTPRMIAKLVEVIDATRTSEYKYEPDIRWAAFFVNVHGKRVHSIYLNWSWYLFTGGGRIGNIDGSVVYLNGSLIGWFERNFLKK
jgi:hypothetical protein